MKPGGVWLVGLTRSASGLIDELHADLAPQPPDNAAVSPHVLAARQGQHELIRHDDTFGMEPCATIGDIGHETVARKRAGLRPELCQAVHELTLMPALFPHGVPASSI